MLSTCDKMDGAAECGFRTAVLVAEDSANVQVVNMSTGDLDSMFERARDCMLMMGNLSRGICRVLIVDALG
jgi:hypothetical protein